MSIEKPTATELRMSWLYEGVWGILTNMFCVPRSAPILPAMAAEGIISRKPAISFLKYAKFQLYDSLAVLAIPAIGISVILAMVESVWFWLLVVVAVGLSLFFGVVGYLTLYLRYDTMWYVFSDRSMRLRRGIWSIRESTITFENIQNVKVIEGPLNAGSVSPTWLWKRPAEVESSRRLAA